MPRKVIYFTVAFLIIAVGDQVTKWWVVQNIELWRGSIDVIPGFFQLVHYQNKGAVGGILGDWGHRLTFFLGFAVVAMGAMLWMLAQLPKDERFNPTMIGLIAGGAVGNTIDRAWVGAVTDFLRFYTDSASWAPWLRDKLGTAEYPSFNVADMGITIGIIAFLISSFFQDEEAQKISAEELPKDGETADTKPAETKPV